MSSRIRLPFLCKISSRFYSCYLSTSFFVYSAISSIFSFSLPFWYVKANLYCRVVSLFCKSFRLLYFDAHLVFLVPVPFIDSSTSRRLSIESNELASPSHLDMKRPAQLFLMRSILQMTIKNYYPNWLTQ